MATWLSCTHAIKGKISVQIMYGRTTKEHVCCTVWGDTTIRYILIKNPKVSVRNVAGRGL